MSAILYYGALCAFVVWQWGRLPGAWFAAGGLWTVLLLAPGVRLFVAGFAAVKSTEAMRELARNLARILGAGDVARAQKLLAHITKETDQDNGGNHG